MIGLDQICHANQTDYIPNRSYHDPRLAPAAGESNTVGERSKDRRGDQRNQCANCENESKIGTFCGISHRRFDLIRHGDEQCCCPQHVGREPKEAQQDLSEGGNGRTNVGFVFCHEFPFGCLECAIITLSWITRHETESCRVIALSAVLYHLPKALPSYNNRADRVKRDGQPRRHSPLRSNLRAPRLVSCPSYDARYERIPMWRLPAHPTCGRSCQCIGQSNR